MVSQFAFLFPSLITCKQNAILKAFDRNRSFYQSSFLYLSLTLRTPVRNRRAVKSGQIVTHRNAPVWFCGVHLQSCFVVS